MRYDHSHFATMIAALAITLCLHGGARGQTHIGDIWLTLANSQVVTGRINPDQTITLSRVFQSTLGDSGFDGFTANPGYDAAHVFNSAYRIGFNILSPLQRWNGNGLEPTGDETMTLSFLTATRTTGACYVPGFDLAVQSDGGWHRHLSMFLNPPSGGTALPGIYIVKLQLYYTAPGAVNSKPYWLVFNHLDSTTNHDAAYAWVIAHLVQPTCPADVNGSGAVDVSDLLTIITSWGIGGGAAWCNSADVNDDGVVNVGDLLAVITAWGNCP